MNTYIETVYNLGQEHLQSCPSYDGNIYCLSRYIPAFTFFALASDAWYGFEDRIHNVTDYCFAQQPRLMTRLLQILTTINRTFSYPLPPGALRKSNHQRISYSTNKINTTLDLNDRGDGWICQQGTVGLMTVHIPHINNALRALAYCRLCMKRLNSIYICNTWNGAVEHISNNTTIPTSDILPSIVSKIMLKDVLLDDSEFIKTYTCV